MIKTYMQQRESKEKTQKMPGDLISSRHFCMEIMADVLGTHHVMHTIDLKQSHVNNSRLR